MSVVKNFGFGYPLVKSSAASRPRESGNGVADRRTFPDQQEGGQFWSSRFSALSTNGHKMSLREYEAWCRQQKAALTDNGEVANGNGHSRFRSFDAAREFARSLGLTSGGDWRRYVQGEMRHLGLCPDDIPEAPQRAYRNDGWQGYADWLGAGDSD